MGNCASSKRIIPKTENTFEPTDITPHNVTTHDIHLYEPKTKQVSITFLKLLIDKNADVDIITTLIDKSVFEISDIVESVTRHMGLSHDYELEMYKYGKSNIKVYFTTEENTKLFELVKMLMKYKKMSIVKRAQDECRDLTDVEKMELLL